MDTDLTWLLILIAGAIGFVVAFIIIKRRPSEFEENLLSCVEKGKRVIFAVEDEAYIFKLLEGGGLAIEQIDIKQIDNNTKT